MAERGLISGEPNRCEVGRDMGRWCVLPRPPARRDYASERKASCNGILSCLGYHKTEPIRRTRNGAGCRGWQIHGHTDDLGPMKPGNRVDDKTLKIRKIL